MIYDSAALYSPLPLRVCFRHVRELDAAKVGETGYSVL